MTRPASAARPAGPAAARAAGLGCPRSAYDVEDLRLADLLLEDLVEGELARRGAGALLLRVAHRPHQPARAVALQC